MLFILIMIFCFWSISTITCMAFVCFPLLFNIEIVGLCNLLKSMDVHISLYIYPFIARQFFRGEVIEDGRAIKLSKNESLYVRKETLV